MTYLRYGFATIMALVLVTIALANSAITQVKLLPDAIAALLGFNVSVSLPLFIILGGAVGLGLMLGFVWEWLREHSYRAEASKLQRENDQLRADLNRVERVAPQTRKDDVLALLEAK